MVEVSCESFFSFSTANDVQYIVLKYTDLHVLHHRRDKATDLWRIIIRRFIYFGRAYSLFGMFSFPFANQKLVSYALYRGELHGCSHHCPCNKQYD